MTLSKGQGINIKNRNKMLLIKKHPRVAQHYSECYKLIELNLLGDLILLCFMQRTGSLNSNLSLTNYLRRGYSCGGM